MRTWQLHVLHHGRYFLALLIVLVPAVAPLVTPTYAAENQVTYRFDRMSTSAPSANATHLIGFRYTNFTDNVGSLSFEFCQNDPNPLLPCTAPAGMDVTGITLASQTGQTGFAISGPETTANRIVLTRTPATPTLITSDAEYRFDDVVNPSTIGSFYLRITTYSSTDASGTYIEEGGVALAIVPEFNVSAEVPPYLIFCSAIVITAFDCSTATAFFIDFGEFSTSTPRYSSSQMVLATNSNLGFSISLSGTSLTSGNNVIPALNPAGGSNPGTSQFGINLRNNSNPNVGANPTGPGVATPIGSYNTPNVYKYAPGDVIVSGPTTTDFKKFTASYVTNISPNQAAGVYATTITYIALANF